MRFVNQVLADTDLKVTDRLQAVEPGESYTVCELWAAGKPGIVLTVDRGADILRLLTEVVQDEDGGALAGGFWVTESTVERMSTYSRRSQLMTHADDS